MPTMQRHIGAGKFAGEGARGQPKYTLAYDPKPACPALPQGPVRVPGEEVGSRRPVGPWS